MHPQDGIPQLHFDQLCVISRHHYEARTGERFFQTVEPGIPSHHTVEMNKLDTSKSPELLLKDVERHLEAGHKFTRRQLLKRDDWIDWNSSEFKQLNQYETQNMFNNPEKLPLGKKLNILPMIWNYLVKTCGTKKARCVADGSPRQSGAITLAHTYAACLEQPAARLFWGAAALKNYQVYGCDCSNAFTEAPHPKAPLHL